MLNLILKQTVGGVIDGRLGYENKNGQQVAIFSRVHEFESCGCSVAVYSLPKAEWTTGPDLVVRDRVGVNQDCPHSHKLGAKITSGGRGRK